jgi:hypothetical protein
VSKQRTEVLYLRVRPEVRARIVELAEQSGLTISDVANELLASACKMQSPHEALKALLQPDYSGWTYGTSDTPEG